MTQLYKRPDWLNIIRPKPRPFVAPIFGRMLVIPIRHGVDWPVLYLPELLMEADWEQLIATLEAMKPGLIKPAPSFKAGGA